MVKSLKTVMYKKGSRSKVQGPRFNQSAALSPVYSALLSCCTLYRYNTIPAKRYNGYSVSRVFNHPLADQQHLAGFHKITGLQAV